jgi:hypothetical protein
MMLRNSERSTFKTCRHRWQWTYRDQRQSASAPVALRFGDLIHRALEQYYIPGIKRGVHPAKTFEALYRKQAEDLGNQGFNVYSDDKWEPALDLGIGMLNGYVSEYKDADSEYKVIQPEMTFQMRVKHPRKVRIIEHELPRQFHFIVVGTMDGVWEHRKTKDVIFKEFKTAASIKLEGLPMDEQASMYWTYGPKFLRDKGILKPSQMPTKILYTFLRKAVPDLSKPRNAEGYILNKPSKDALIQGYRDQGRNYPTGTGAKGAVTVDDMLADLPGAELLGEVSKVQPAPYFARVPVYRDRADRERAHNRICEEALDIAKARAGQLFLGKNPGPLHMPNCMGCAVREACEVHEAGGDFDPILNSSMIKWNPYAAHELAERK